MLDNPGSRSSTAEATLADLQARMQAILDSRLIGVVVTDLDGRIRDCNGTFADLLDYPPAELKKKSLFDVSPPHQHAALRSCLEALRLQGSHPPYEKEYLTRDGKTVPALAGTSILNRATGECIKFIVDLREQKRLERQVLLSDRLVAMGNLAAGMAHEINNPLAYAASNLELLAESLARSSAGTERPSFEDLQAMIKQAAEGIERVRLIVKDLKTFSRVDDTELREIDIHDAIEGAIRIASNEIRPRATLERCYGETPPVLANENRLSQVIVNLLINAAQAIPEGNPGSNRICLSTSTRVDGSVQIEVSDTGSGIPPEILEKIFEPFFTTKPPGQGTGLGLAVCHGIIASLGGTIHASNRPGQGAAFNIVLPRSREQRAEERKPPAARVSEPAESLRIVIIDDEEPLAEAMARALGRRHQTHVAHGADQGLALIRELHPDLVICDLMMPGKTGMDLHRELASCLPEVLPRIIFATGGSFTPKSREFLKSVHNPVIEKPFSLQQLREIVERTAQGLGPKKPTTS